jgi:hypothetical protein
VLLLLFAAEEPTGRFVKTPASEFGKGVRAVNDDLTIVTLVVRVGPLTV